MSLLVVLSGPSGVGKDAVLAKMKASDLPLYYAVTMTTRPRRPGERDGVDYYFASEASFRDMVEKKELLEWAKVYGNFYGVPKQQVRQALDRGQNVMLKVDVQGAVTIKKLVSGAVLIFLTSSVEEQQERLTQRMSESPEDMRLRLGTYNEEIKNLPVFDYVVVNCKGELGKAVSQIEAIVTAEKCRVNPRPIDLK